MDKELKTELCKIKESYHRIDKNVIVLITKFDGIEEKVGKLNGITNVLTDHEVKLAKHGTKISIGLGLIITIITGIVSAAFWVIRK